MRTLLLTLILTVFLGGLTMAYSTDQDLQDRVSEDVLIQLTDDTGNATQPDSAVMDSRRNDAEELIHTFLRGRYEVPLDPAPPVLANIEADITLQYLYKRRPHIEIPETVQQSYEDSLKLLEKVSRGEIQLEDQPNPGGRSFASNKDSTDRRFNDDTLDHF